MTIRKYAKECGVEIVGKLLLWESTEVVAVNIDDDGDEEWGDESINIQYPTPKELVSFTLAYAGAEDDEEEEE